MSHAYLLINFFTILIPFALSFHPKIRFHKTWRAFFQAAALAAIFFIAWDIWFTHMGVWGFNERYLIGVDIVNLPLEEFLFFLCIPYACVFSFRCLDLYLEEPLSGRSVDVVTGALIVILLITALLFHRQIYTLITFATLAALLILARFILRIEWLGTFYVAYALLLIPFFLVNGTLTGMVLEEPVVWYNEEEIIGIRLGMIPLEDLFYGMELILLNVLIYLGLLEKRGPVAESSGQSPGT